MKSLVHTPTASIWQSGHPTYMCKIFFFFFLLHYVGSQKRPTTGKVQGYSFMLEFDHNFLNKKSLA